MTGADGGYRCDSGACLQVEVTGASTRLWESSQPGIEVVTSTASWQARLQAERDAERARFVAWLREHAGDTNCLDDCELFTEYADMIERGEFDDLAAGDE